MTVANAAPETAAVTPLELPHLAPNGELRRTLRLAQRVLEARPRGSHTLLSGAGVNDVFVDRVGRVLPLDQLLRSIAQHEGLGFVTYRMGTGVVSWPTLPEEERIRITGGPVDEHPAQVLERIVADVRAAGQPAIVLLDYFDEVLPVDSGPDLRLGLLSESIKALTADVPGWHALGLQLVIVDRGAGIHQRIVHHPGISVVDVPPPDATEAQVYLQLKQSSSARVPLHLDPSTDAARLGRLSGGLLLRDLGELAALSRLTNPVGAVQVSLIKGMGVRRSSHGTLLHVGDSLDFATDLAGQHVVRLVIQQELDLGKSTIQVVLCGPAGTGKSRSAAAIAGLLGVPLVRLGTILGPLMGMSENNMQRALDVLRAMAPVCLFIDEADKGQLGDSNGGSTGNEAYGAIAQMLFEFTGDTDQDHGVSIITATNVPTRLDTRTKDRFQFLPVLLANGPEIAQVMAIQARRGRVPLVDDLTEVMSGYVDAHRILSGRSSKEVLRSAHLLALKQGSPVVTAEHVVGALATRRGTDWTREAEYSTLTSLMMTSTKDRLPWEAARELGETYPVPDNLQPFFVGGELDNDSMARRAHELDLGGVYR